MTAERECWIEEQRGPGIRTDLSRHIFPVRAIVYARIKDDFVRWELTPAERHVAHLMLKGLQLKAIAQARDTREQTVSEQARAVYRKAGVEGRAGLDAYFLRAVLEVLEIEPQVSV